jgi:hypothetical protein
MDKSLQALALRFDYLDTRLRALINRTPDEKLYLVASETDALFPVNSIGEYVLRSAGTVEQTFGGITTRLWDDPFEWTLPEKLSTRELILEYLDEVADTRKRGFSFFSSDEDLGKRLPAPVEIKSLFELLLDTLLRAENFLGRAEAVEKIVNSDT